jgi:hypothetical protein
MPPQLTPRSRQVIVPVRMVALQIPNFSTFCQIFMLGSSPAEAGLYRNMIIATAIPPNANPHVSTGMASVRLYELT